MIRKNTNIGKRDASPGRIRNTSKPTHHSSPQKQTFHNPPSPAVLPHEIPKL